MSRLNTPLDVYKLLSRANCGECGIATCMAFAVAVIRQEKQLGDCPRLDRSIPEQFSGRIKPQVNLERIQQEQRRQLQEAASTIDLLSRTEATGGRTRGESLVITCLGKDFEVDPAGRVSSSCHTHAWFSIPLLDYILTSSGCEVSGRWVPLRELPNGRTWSRLFEQRCEKPLKQLADSHNELFEDLIALFSAASSFNTLDADISVVLYPLPRVPLLICYRKPEGDMESKLHLFLDETAESHLHIESLFTLATGIVMMLEKIMLRHTNGKSILA